MEAIIITASLPSQDQNKIIILGLAESGKSTIIKTITEGKIPEKAEKYSATMNYERKLTAILGKKVSIFDLGGQVSFLDRFTGELAEFVFSNVQCLIFVVDVTKFEEVSRAKYYLDLCLKNVDKYSPSSYKYVFIHKIDLVKHDKLNDITNSLKEFLIGTYKGKIDFYPTTIYEESIFKAMGDVYAKVSGVYNTLDPILGEFLKQNAGIIKIGQVFTKEGTPLTKSDDTKNISINQILPILNLLALQLNHTTIDSVKSLFFETLDDIYNITFTELGAVVFFCFSKKIMNEEKEKFLSLSNKVNLFTHELNSIVVKE